jgi:hypothetical protein
MKKKHLITISLLLSLASLVFLFISLNNLTFNIVSTGGNAGGLVGENSGTIIDSYATGTVSGGNSEVNINIDKKVKFNLFFSIFASIISISATSSLIIKSIKIRF